ncbi:MAG: N-6 DNA methylase [Chloroflexi bacterium]|nr:N-6 DNA methylase [Chloroflexota bacterium]
MRATARFFAVREGCAVAAGPVEQYLTSLGWFLGVGVAETSGYGALQALLDAAGETLRPRVRCVLHPRNRGSGLPDGGLFTVEQLTGHAGDRFPSPLPARGAVEVKGPADDLAALARSAQVRRYLGEYRLVLLTNYRAFLLVSVDDGGRPEPLEGYVLAAGEGEFRRVLAQPQPAVDAHAGRLLDFLRRALLHAAPLTRPDDLAWLLAAYAREARARVEAQGNLPTLASVRRALEQSLGITFTGERGDRFFRSTLVQTLFYGIFAAWVLWHRQTPRGDDERFTWHETGFLLHVPVIAALFTQLAQPNRLRPLGLVEVLDWTQAALNRVDRAAFFARFDEAHAVQYFYEPFLEAFDPALRRELGVWYTPPEIVRYMVARVDAALRTELGLPAGLADPRVVVLDPCCGTGAYLIEVLRHIDATLAAAGDDALRAEQVKQAALRRVFGFELLPAPFVIAHLQLGLLLREVGAPLADHERAAVYLTNALTGWRSREERPALLPFPELAAEHDAAEHVKLDEAILVVLGNPPYSGYAGLAEKEEADLTAAYRTTVRAPKPQGQGLNDLYVRFFRMAERRIVERTGRGVVCFIANYSWLDGLSFTGMRERYLAVFDRLWIDCLNGDKYKTGKLTPAGDPDPSIFSTPLNREGIQVGTAIALLVRRQPSGGAHTVAFRHLWGTRKREELAATADQPDDRHYTIVTPPLALGLPFQPASVAGGYLDWPLLPDLLPTSFPGVKTSRDDMLVNIDRDRLAERMRDYLDPALSHEAARRLLPGLMTDSKRFPAEATRTTLLKRGFRAEQIVRYCYRPFDLRWLYWEPETKLLDEKRAEYVPHVFEGNVWLSAGQRNRKEDFYQPQVTTRLADHHLVESNVGMFPLYLAADAGPRDLFSVTTSGLRPNLSPAAVDYLAGLAASAADLFHHALAVLHAPAYRADNAGGLRQDWPRLPLPADAAQLGASAALGRQVAALLDPGQAMAGVTAPPLRPDLRLLGVTRRAGGGQLSHAAGDLAVRAGWGHAGQGGVTMPGRGRAVERAPTAAEAAALAEGATALGLEAAVAGALLGATTYDVYLNDVAYWANVPAGVWSYTLGGYQVLKKWLSYREQALLGRDLTPDEGAFFGQVVRRIAALLLLGPALDANYRASAAAVASWQPTDRPGKVGA